LVYTAQQVAVSSNDGHKLTKHKGRLIDAVERILATLARTNVQRVIHRWGDGRGGHVLGNGVAATTKRCQDNNNGDHNADNGGGTKTNAEGNARVVVGAVDAAVSVVALAHKVERGVGVVACGGGASLVDTNTIAAALVGAWLRHVYNSEDALWVGVEGASRLGNASALGERAVVRESEGRAPLAEDAIGQRSGVARSAVDNVGQVGASLLERRRDVAVVAAPCGTIRVGDADTLASSARAMARAERAVVVARRVGHAGQAASRLINSGSDANGSSRTGQWRSCTCQCRSKSGGT